MTPSQKSPSSGKDRDYTAKPRIVVAEDDEIFRGLLSELLRDCNLAVCEAADGVELLEILAESAGSDDHADRVDLVISDVCVPEYSSIELILGIHAAKMGIPLITFTTFGGRRTQVLSHNPQDILLEEESFDLDGFRDMVLDLLRDSNGPKSMRITLRPPGVPNPRLSDIPLSPSVTLFDAESPNGQSGVRTSSLASALASNC
jgi:CheY-like chemotaxis protein